MQKSFFINGFQKGQQETSQIGMGNIVGIDTYSKKGVARLSKKSTVIQTYADSTPFPGYPTFTDTSGAFVWLQLSDGSVIYSGDGGVTWQPTAAAFPTGSTTHGNGLIFFQNYMFAFTDTKIYYWLDTSGAHGVDPTAGAWVDWTTAKGLGALQLTTNSSPLNSPHFPFLYPSNKGVYFCNGGAGGVIAAVAGQCTIGFFGQVGTTTFNPAGTIDVDFAWDNGILSLPSFTYIATNLNFLPPTSLAISAYPNINPAQGGDLITWDTVTKNKFSPPLRFFSNSLTGNAAVGAGIKQLFNRNQVLYAVTGGNHSVFETNASSYNLVEDIALYSSIRFQGGGERDYPVFFDSFPSAICVLGNKLLTGTAPTSNNSTIYPPAFCGFFPVGVWGISFNPDGSKSTQCEYVIPLGNSLVTPTGDTSHTKITLVKPIDAQSGTAQLMVGFSYKDSNGQVYGIATVDLYNYIDNIEYNCMESEFYEIGTALNPETINTIEINLIKFLATGQTIRVQYRKSLGDDWSLVTGNGGTFNGTFTGDGTTNFYQITDNNIGKTQFVQFRIQMATTGSPAALAFNSPEIRSIKFS